MSTTIRLALSDYIYTGDTVTAAIESGVYTQGTASSTFSGSVTNNSALAPPKVIARWATVSYQRVTANFLLEAVCIHQHAKDGKQVACVIFEVDDESANHYETTVTEMTVSALDGAGNAAANKVLVYAATIPIAGFAQGDILTCKFTAYPWIGEAFASDTGGFTAPDERLTNLHMLCDKAGTYGGGFCVVDATNGGAITTADFVYDTEDLANTAYGSAATNSYQSIGHAVQALQAYNNAEHSRNNPGGGTILISGVGTIGWPGTQPASALNAMDTWATIRPKSGVSRASAVITLNATSGPRTPLLRVYNCSFAGSGSGIGMRSGANNTHTLWLDTCAINTAQTSNVLFGPGSGNGGWALAFATNNTITQIATSSTANGFRGAPFALVRGNEGPVLAATGLGISCPIYCVLGNYNLRILFQSPGNSEGNQVTDNAVVAFNSHYHLTNAWQASFAAVSTVAHGVAYVQNLIERTGETVDWLAIFTDETAGSSFTNMVFQHNTGVGQRIGMAFNWNDNSYVPHLQYSQVGNLWNEYANKDDATATGNAVRTGGWAVGHHVNSRSNHRLSFASTPEWAGEYSGDYTVDGGTWLYVDDASTDGPNDPGLGDDSGNGDYHLDATHSAYALIEAGQAVLPYDLEGTPRNNDGGGSAGVFEMNPPEEPPPPVIGSGRRLVMTGGL
jgi:hypothetical protein